MMHCTIKECKGFLFSLLLRLNDCVLVDLTSSTTRVLASIFGYVLGMGFANFYIWSVPFVLICHIFSVLDLVGEIWFTGSC